MADFDRAASVHPLTTGPACLRRRWRRAVRAVVAAEVTERRSQLKADVQPMIDASLRTVLDREVDQKLGSALEPLQIEHTRLADREFTSRLLLGAGTRVDRAVSEARCAALVTQLQELTGEHELGWPLLKAYRGLLDAETRGLGRIAGSTPNVLGKLVATPLLRTPAGPVLEIGTLYGLFAPVLLRQFAQYGDFRHLTVLDPFAGLQLQPGIEQRRDHTGTPVSAEVARANFATFGLSAERLRMITGYSGDPEVQAEVADRRYAVVIIDGDHSENGVSADLRWVEQIVAPGGVVVMDDYGDRTWPGVTRAVEAYLAENGRLRLIGTAATSAFLRADA